MICSQCKLENPNTARFCSNCGSLLPLRCTNCEAELAADAHFCMQCGQPVRQQTPDDEARHTRLAASVPAPLAAKVRSAPLTGERRTVTVLFADVVGSTMLAEQVDVEAWTEIMNGAFECLTPAVYRYEGTIARLQGDSLLAFFGAPVAHEDDPVRAALAALDALGAIKAYSEQVRRQFGIDFEMRFCLNSGPVVTGPINTDMKYEYTAMGGAVNLAVLLKFSNRPMAVVITENTHRFIAPLFDLTELDPVAVKGHPALLKAYEIVNLKLAPGSLRGLVGLESPMVGRDVELASLIRLYDTVRSGLGRAVLISGDPGLGKSRLIAEWQENIAKSSHPTMAQWAEGRCLSYGQGMAHHLVLDLLRSLLGLSLLSSEIETRSALHSLVDDLFPPGSGDQAEEIYTYLGHLLMLDLEDESLERVHLLDPQALQAQYVSALRKLLQSLAARRPLILILEDLHWIDPSSSDLIASLLTVVFSAPVLFCLVSRLERDTPGFKLIAYAREALGSGLTEIQLEALSAEESRRLVANLLAIEALPELLRSVILQKSEGNPFFVEEIVRMLIERGAIVQHGSGWKAGSNLDNLDIPDNLQGLLMARIDRLSEQGKNTLKVAAVVGRQFPVKVLQQVLSSKGQPIPPAFEDTVGTLSNLESAGLIRVAQVQPDLEYYFRHSLVQDAAYGSLLSTDRRRLHKAVGETVEAMYPDQLSSCELAPRLAQHFNEAGDTQRAFKYFKIAGDSALDCYANQEAEDHFQRGLELSIKEVDRTILLAGLGEAVARQSRFSEAISTWRQAIDYYLSIGDLDRVARLYAKSARAAWWDGNTPLSLSLCQEGLQAVAGAPESSNQAFLIHETARAYHFNGVPRPAQELCLQALEMAKRMGDVEVQADALTTLGILPDLSPQESTEALAQAINLAESAGLLIIASRAHTNMGSMMKAFYGDLESARFHYQRALDIAKTRGVVQEQIFALEILVGIFLEKGDRKSVEEMLPALEQLISELSNPTSALTEYKLIKSMLLFWQGAWDEGLNLMRENRELVRRSGDLQNLFNVNMNFVGTSLEKSLFDLEVDWSEVETALEESLALSERGLGDRSFIWCYYALVRLEQGRVAEAEACFSQTAKYPGSGSNIWRDILLIWTRAEIAGGKGLWRDSDLAFEQAYNFVKKLDQRWYKGRIILGWAEMLIKQGDPASLERARGLLREAYSSFASMPAPSYLERIEKHRQQVHELSLAQAAAQNEVVQEMAQARRVQKSFLPEAPPSITGWDLAAALEPARETSGDYYDFIPLPGDCLGIVIADVADKGAGAALFMASSRTLIRTYAAQYPDSPAHVLAAANQRLVVDTHAGLFITLFYAILDPLTGKMIYCNAGHNPPVLMNPGLLQAAQWLTKTGMPLGVIEDAAWGEAVLILKSGDILTLFTDGITEAQNKAGEFFGETRVQFSIEETLKNQLENKGSAKSTLDGLLECVHQFMDAAPRTDDITLMVIRRN